MLGLLPVPEEQSQGILWSPIGGQAYLFDQPPGAVLRHGGGADSGDVRIEDDLPIGQNYSTSAITTDVAGNLR